MSDLETQLRAAMEELLKVADQIRVVDTKIDPQQWYATRDYARVVLKRAARETLLGDAVILRDRLACEGRHHYACVVDKLIKGARVADDAGVAFEDQRLDYVELQVERGLWEDWNDDHTAHNEGVPCVHP